MVKAYIRFLNLGNTNKPVHRELMIPLEFMIKCFARRAKRPSLFLIDKSRFGKNLRSDPVPKVFVTSMLEATLLE